MNIPEDMALALEDSSAGQNSQPWDAQDDPPDALPELLRVAGWDEARVTRCRAVYEALSPASVPDEACATAIARFLTRIGVPPSMEAHYCRAMTRGPRLTFYDFLVGLVAMDPTTAHGGVWNGLRAQYVFRVYDVNCDGELSVAELATLVSHVKLAYGHPAVTREEERSEAAALHASLAGAAAGATAGATAGAAMGASGARLSLGVFRDAVGQLRLRGCSRLFRSEFPLFQASEEAPSAVAALPPASADGAPAPLNATAAAAANATGRADPAVPSCAVSAPAVPPDTVPPPPPAALGSAATSPAFSAGSPLSSNDLPATRRVHPNTMTALPPRRAPEAGERAAFSLSTAPLASRSASPLRIDRSGLPMTSPSRHAKTEAAAAAAADTAAATNGGAADANAGQAVATQAAAEAAGSGGAAGARRQRSAVPLAVSTR